MSMITVQDGRFQVDAAEIGQGFGLEPAHVPELMRQGQITSRCEQGIDKDAGRWRLSFFHRNRALRLTVDEEGRILSRARFDTSAGS